MRAIAASCLLAYILVFAAAGAIAQSTAPPASAIVSIKPSGTATRVNSDASSTDRFDWPDVTLAMLIRDAYGLFESQVIGGPDWMNSKRWDVSATVASLTPDEARQLVRRLVEDRFALKAHAEMRELPVYNLTVMRAGRLGPKIKPATVDCTPFLTGQRPMQESPRDPSHRFGLCSEGGSFTPGGLLTPRLNGQPLTGLIQHLQEALERPVLDRTGLKGNYDIELSYLDETLADKSSPRIAAQGPLPKGPSLITALQDQLGMKLELVRAPVEVLVIDAVSEPSAK